MIRIEAAYKNRLSKTEATREKIGTMPFFSGLPLGIEQRTWTTMPSEV
jgi:hypothetical protein